ncbi:MAG: hypothetical protein ACKOU7_12390 [Ferruginibacter sp.]
MKNIHPHTGKIGWIARIISIAFAIFISIFAMDVFSEGYGVGNTLLALLIHLVPTGIIILVLALSWHHEWVGAIIFTILAIAYLIAGWGKSHWSAIVLISGPLFILGILFFISWREKNTCGI